MNYCMLAVIKPGLRLIPNPMGFGIIIEVTMKVCRVFEILV